MSGHDTEELLQGGMANAGAVVRIGDEVRRPSSATTPAVFALVHHVRSRGFTAVPEALGIDELGRERWQFVSGDVPIPPFPAWAQTDELLASTAAMLRQFHDAVADFEPPADAVWNDELAHPGGGPIVGHNDVCPENVICRDGEAVALIDFDFAAPTHPYHDLGQLAKMWVPLVPDDDAARSGRAGLDRFARLRIVADAYGLAIKEREPFLDIVVASMHGGSTFVRRRVERGEQPFIDAWKATGGEAYFARRSAWIDANRAAFLTALTRP